jgi:photosystem II stability/assembly factor-like uncharacterized protein
VLRQRLGTVALVAFVILDVVLVVLALRHTNDPAPDSSASQTSRAGESPGPGATSPGVHPSHAALPAGPVYLAVAPDGTLLRATRGSCGPGAAPRVAVSTDGGAKFRRLQVDKSLRAVLAVRSESADDLSLVGADTDCDVHAYSGDAHSSSWDHTTGTQGRWHLQPNAKRSAVAAPSGPVDMPCTPISLTVVASGGPRVLCDTGTILGSADTGKTWVALGHLADAVAIEYVSPSHGYAAAPHGSCPAAVLETTDGGTSWSSLKCFRGSKPRSVAARGDMVAVQMGDVVHVSTDGGKSWS